MSASAANIAGEVPYRYDGSATYLAGLSEELLAAQPPTAMQGRYVCYRFDGSDEFANLGRSVEHDVFERHFKNTAEDLQADFAPYEAASKLFVVMDRRRKLAAGALRVTSYSEQGLLTLNDIAADPLNLDVDQVREVYGMTDLNKVKDIGTVAIMHGYRKLGGHLVSTLLYRGMHLDAVAEGAEHYVSVIDQNVYKAFQTTGIPFEPILGTGPFEYKGSKQSLAVHGNVADFTPSVAAAARANALRHPLQAAVTSRLVNGISIDHKYMFKI